MIQPQTQAVCVLPAAGCAKSGSEEQPVTNTLPWALDSAQPTGSGSLNPLEEAARLWAGVTSAVGCWLVDTTEPAALHQGKYLLLSSQALRALVLLQVWCLPGCSSLSMVLQRWTFLLPRPVQGQPRLLLRAHACCRDAASELLASFWLFFTATKSHQGSPRLDQPYWNWGTRAVWLLGSHWSRSAQDPEQPVGASGHGGPILDPVCFSKLRPPC